MSAAPTQLRLPIERFPRSVRRLLRGRRARPALLGMVLVAGMVAMSCSSGGGEQKAVERAPIPVRVTKVGKGDLAVTLSYSGELKSVDTVDVLPTATGRVEDIFADEGMTVAAGQPLARLETDALSAQVRQAQAGVQSAQAKLDQILAGARPEEIAVAQAQLDAARQRYQTQLVGSRPEDVASAQAAVQSSRAKLADLEAGTKAADLAAAQASVDTASANVARDEAKLRALINPTQLDIASAQTAVDSSEATIRSAQAKVDDLKAYPKPLDRATAEAAVASAQKDLTAAQQAYSRAIAPLNDEKLKKLIDAYQAILVARQRLDDARTRNASAAEIGRLENDVRQALVLLQKAEEDTKTFVIGVRAEDVIALKAAQDSADSALKKAQENLNTVLSGTTATDMQTAQAALDKARSDRDANKVKLDKLMNPTDADIQTARAAVDGSRASLESATAKLNQLQAGATQADLDAARASVAQTASALAKAQQPFLESELATTAATVTQQENATAQVVTKYTKPDVDSAVAAVAQAQAAVEVAQINLNRATMVAPFDAVVVKKNVSKGTIVGTTTSILSLVSQDTQVYFNVEEGSIGRLREGQRVNFTVAAFGDRRFEGTIVSIAPTADASSRTFRVRANMSGNRDGLRAGMFANVNVTVQSRNGVLTVPTDALIQQGQDNFVLVVKDDKADRRKVTLGLRNDANAEVTEGLQEGEQVVTRGNRTPLRPDDKVVVVQ